MKSGDNLQLSFLIVGAGRGGTSLLMGILDNHRLLEIGYETHAMDCLMGLDLDQPSSEFKSELAYHRARTFKHRCDQEAKFHLDKIWGNKITTEQIYGLEDHNSANGTLIDIKRIFFLEILADVKIIFICRDGRTCVRSKLSRTGQSLAHACTRWQYSVDMMRFLKREHPNAFFVRFEDLVSDPENTLRSTCEFLEIEYEDQMLSGLSNSKIREEYQSEKIDCSKLELTNVPPLCVPLLMDDLHELGYLNRWQYLWLRLRHTRWLIFLLPILALAFVLLCYLMKG